MAEPVNPALQKMLLDVPVAVDIVLGEFRLSLEELIALAPGEIVALERRTHEPADIYVSGKLVARGKLMVADGQLAITVTEILDLRPAA